MDQEQLITALRLVCVERVATAVTLRIHDSSRSRPSVQPAVNLEEFATHVAEQGLYNFLLLLDGLLAVEDGQDKGRLVLSYQKDGRMTPLNDPEGENLTSIYKGLVGRAQR